MQKKYLYFTISMAILSLLHLLFSYFYIRMYGYFNLHGSLNGFIVAAQLFRLALSAFIILCGFFAIREEKQKLLPFYLLFFLFNLILPFLFHV